MNCDHIKRLRALTSDYIEWLSLYFRLSVLIQLICVHCLIKLKKSSANSFLKPNFDFCFRIFGRSRMRPDYISAVGRDEGRVGHSIIPTRANCRSAFDRLQPVGQTCLRRRPQELVPCVCRNLRRNDRTGKFCTLLWATFIS